MGTDFWETEQGAWIWVEQEDESRVSIGSSYTAKTGLHQGGTFTLKRKVNPNPWEQVRTRSTPEEFEEYVLGLEKQWKDRKLREQKAREARAEAEAEREKYREWHTQVSAVAKATNQRMDAAWYMFKEGAVEVVSDAAGAGILRWLDRGVDAFRYVRRADDAVDTERAIERADDVIDAERAVQKTEDASRLAAREAQVARREALLRAEYEHAKEFVEAGSDWKKYLTKKIGSAPDGMANPHAHHILFKEGLGSAQQRLVGEGQAILRRHGIDPVYGVENLIWAPNRVKGQHGIDALQGVVDQLKAVDRAGGDYDDIVRVLKELGEVAANRR
ncbi:MAG: AHH domain-containing protein [Planctomycetota bacterium]|nr:AHH domain-containing protein [Planctomycetota bacterium]